MDLFATHYMTRFACIRPRYEDNYCHSWSVPMDHKHYDLLREKMASPEEKDEFLRAEVENVASGAAWETRFELP